MKATATNIYAGRLESLAGNCLLAAGLLPDYWVVLQVGVPDQLLFINGEALGAQCWPSTGHQGYFCAFTPLFMPEKLMHRIKRLSLFAVPGKGVIKLSRMQASAVSQIFELLLAEVSSQYHHKLDLMHNYVIQIIHFGLKNAGSAS